MQLEAISKVSYYFSNATGMIFGRCLEKVMEKKPVKPQLRRVFSYIFSGIRVATPIALYLLKRGAKSYGTLGSGLFIVNALRSTPIGLMRRVLSFKRQQNAGSGFLTGLSLLSFINIIRKDKRVLAIPLGLLTVAMVGYVLTNYSSSKLSKA